MIKLSPYVRTFYDEWMINPKRSDSNVVFNQELFGEIDVSRLDFALNRFVQDYFILHSPIKRLNDEYYWVEDKKFVVPLDLFESPSEICLSEYVSRPFDMLGTPLLRVALIKLGKNHFRFVAVTHHLIMDAAKATRFVEYLSNYYNDENFCADLSLDEQKERLTTLGADLYASLAQQSESHTKFWEKQLDEISAVNLGFLRPPTYLFAQENAEIAHAEPDVRDLIGAYRFFFGIDVLERVNYLKQMYSITPFVFGQLVFAILLHLYTRQEKFAFSYVVAIQAGKDFFCGSHINTVFIPYSFESKRTLREIIEDVKAYFASLRAGKHHYFPTRDILNNFKNRGILDVTFLQTNLRDTKFSFDQVPKVRVNGEFNIEVIQNLAFEQEVKSGRIDYRVRYKKTQIDEALLLNFIESYQRVFLEVLEDMLTENLDKDFRSYSIMTEKQCADLLERGRPLNLTPLASQKTIHQLFEEQVLKTPDTIALVCGGAQLTYRQLNARANQLAWYLIHQHGVGPDQLVALCLDRNEEMLVTILAVLKSGGAYVPLDASYPDERIAYTLKDTATKILLTNAIWLNRLEGLCDHHAVQLIAIDEPKSHSDFMREPESNPHIQMSDRQLAYVIYTSGTTGYPKGVMIEHKSVVSLMKNFTFYPLMQDANFNMLSSTNYVFDAFVLEYLLPLLNGYRVELIDLANPLNKVSLRDYDCTQITPSKLELLIEQIDYSAVEEIPRKIILLIGGETLGLKALSRVQEMERFFLARKKHVKFEVVNMYGPTETTILSTAACLTDNAHSSVALTIGRPLLNEQVYILDEKKNLVPVGAIGELYIGGGGLARGYWNQSELTTQHFLHNPFQTEEEKNFGINSRLYKTGDLGRWLMNGEIEYLGRSDSQVKIRGYRVELKEIEAKLASYPGIKQAVVVVKSQVCGEDNYLVAYYVSDQVFSESDLRDHLAMWLPKYMLPSALVHLERLPLTISGKLDKKALPDPALHKQSYSAPRNKREKLVCKVFCNVLCVNRVGIEDDFFELGGDSIKAIALVARLQENFKVTVEDVFNFRTPEKLVKHVTFAKNHLEQQRGKIKKVFQKNEWVLTRYQLDKLDQYVSLIGKLPVKYTRKPIRNVLLTGATGYLGCNLLNQLLSETDYKIFLIVRAKSNDEAFLRVNQKFEFYFNKNLDETFISRLIVFAGDIEGGKLGVSPGEYQFLTQNVDSIIHAAALTKHYGEYERFYSANVGATVNLLELSRLTDLKDFHYISTSSVLKHAQPSKKHARFLYTENDLPNGEHENVYVLTKYEAEKEVLKFREKGVRANIFRVGNLVFMQGSYQMQENIRENGFFNQLKCIAQLGIAASEVGMREISPVDLTANAIIKLFDRQEVSNEIHHVFNPNVCNVAELFSKNKQINVKWVSLPEFVDVVFECLEDPLHQQMVERFLLHQGWLDDELFPDVVDVLQDKTKFLLHHLGFTWPVIEQAMFDRFIEKNAQVLSGGG